MTSPTTRRPLPALVFLVALTLLAALVWWRVLDRDSGHASAEPSCTPSTSGSAPKQLPEQRAVVVQVLNSTKRQGIAATAQKALVADGFQAPARADNDSKAYPGYSGEVKGVAEIRSGPAGTAGAQLLQYYFPGATIVRTNEQDATVLVSLGAQYKKVLPQGQVAAALRQDGIKLVAVSGGLSASGSAGNCPSSAS